MFDIELDMVIGGRDIERAQWRSRR
jgi:hypothetical protein